MSNEKLHIYIRVSSETQSTDGFGLENQRELGLRICDQKGWEPILYDEGSKSSSNDDLTNRPQMVRLLDEIDRGNVKYVWVYEIDRLSRNKTTQYLITNKMREKNITLLVGSGTQYDLGDFRDALLHGIMSEIAQFDQAQRTERLRRGRLSKVKIGGWKGGPPPYGYKISEGFLVENPDTSEWVKKIYSWYSQGKTIREIQNELLSKGVLTPRRKLLWNENSIIKILQNTHYEGYHYYSDKKLGEEVRVDNPPILPSSLIKSVRDRIKKTRVHTSRNQKHFTLLNGLLFCGQCGTKFGQRIQRHKHYNNYYCRGNENRNRTLEGMSDKVCKTDTVRTRSVNIPKTDALIWDTVVDTLSNSQIFKESFKKELLGTNVSYAVSKTEKRALEKEHKKRFKELQKIRSARSSALAQGLLDKKDIKDIQRIFDENERELKTKIEQISTQMSENEESKKWVDWVNKFGEKIDTLKSTELSLSEKKEFLEGVLDKIMVKTVDHDKHQFHLQFKLPYVNDDLEYDLVKGRKTNFRPKDGRKSQKLTLSNTDRRRKSLPADIKKKQMKSAN